MRIYKVIRLRLPKLPFIKRRRYFYNSPKRLPKNFFRWIFLLIAAVIIFLFLFLLLRPGKKGGEVITPQTETADQNRNLLFLKEIIPFFQYGTSKEAEPSSEALKGSENDWFSSYFTLEGGAFASSEVFEKEKLEAVSTYVNVTGQEPKILIFHTHASENYIDSRQAMVEDTVVGVGNTLADILAKSYGLYVVHDTGVYDIGQEGKVDTSGSYDRMAASVQALLAKYPSVEVLIDIHRDGVPADRKLVTKNKGRQTAMLMFVNGLCYENKDGLPQKTEGMENPYILENLGFSYKMQKYLETAYPGLMRKIYLKPYRYSLYLKPMSLLVEVGANTSSVEEAKNAMVPLAEALVQVLSEKDS